MVVRGLVDAGFAETAAQHAVDRITEQLQAKRSAFDTARRKERCVAVLRMLMGIALLVVALSSGPTSVLVAVAPLAAGMKQLVEVNGLQLADFALSTVTSAHRY